MEYIAIVLSGLVAVYETIRLIQFLFKKCNDSNDKSSNSHKPERKSLNH